MLNVIQGGSLVAAAEAVCSNERHIVVQAVFNKCCLCMMEARSETRGNVTHQQSTLFRLYSFHEYSVCIARTARTLPSLPPYMALRVWVAAGHALSCDFVAYLSLMPF